MVRWRGGYVVGTAASPTSSVGIQARDIRNFKASDVRIDGFKYGMVLAGLDTFAVRDTHFYNNDISIHLPQYQTESPNLGHLMTLLDNVHFSISGKTSAVLIEELWADFEISHSSFNGDAVASIHIKDYSDVSSASVGLGIHDSHFEQIGAGHKYIYLDDANSKGFYGVNIWRCHFNTSPSLAIAAYFTRTKGLRIGGGTYFRQTAVSITGDGTTNGVNVTSGSATVTFSGTADTTGLVAGQYVIAPGVPMGTTINTVDSSSQVTLSANADGTFTYTSATFNVSTPIYLDANCTDIVISKDCIFSTAKPIYLCDRKQISFEPHVRMINASGAANPITGLDGATLSTSSATTLDMRVILGGSWPNEAPPIGYDIIVTAADSGSGTGGPWRFRIFNPSENSNRKLSCVVSGNANGTQISASGFVAAIKYGNVAYDCLASGY